MHRWCALVRCSVFYCIVGNFFAGMTGDVLYFILSGDYFVKKLIYRYSSGFMVNLVLYCGVEYPYVLRY